MISLLEERRVQLSRSTDGDKKSRLGQFFTPASTADFMAGMFPRAGGVCRLLDAGAGIGSLSAAFLSHWQEGHFDFSRVELDAFECDNSLAGDLGETLTQWTRQGEVIARVRMEDFILSSVETLSNPLFSRTSPGYTHSILNPPYKKIQSHSRYRQGLRSVGIECVNLYAAFVSLALALSAPGAQIVAIIPRSFCNGTYYLPFRRFLLSNAALRHIHLFKSRTEAFRDDSVLQENIIIRLEKGGTQAGVRISTSTDDSFSDLTSREYTFCEIVPKADDQLFIHIPTNSDAFAPRQQNGINLALNEIGVSVSTGPIVDFRLREHLRMMPQRGTVPLLYPVHFKNGVATWPIEGLKKPNAIHLLPETRKWIYPNGYYCVVRRLSSKEEKRRIVASFVDPSLFPESNEIAFENHLNVFHENKRGLSESLARGLCFYLNSTHVDQQFRSFSGHTQVNATDLRLLKYPSTEVLCKLGDRSREFPHPTQTEIDALLSEALHEQDSQKTD